ncbi:MAG TPA: TolC family protein [Parasegetibacter sp.]
MIHRKIILAFLFTIAAGLYSIAQEKWDLRKCVEYAIANNISVKQADIQQRIAELQLKESELSQYPNANFSTGVTWGFGRTRDFSTQTIVSQNSFGNSFGLQSNVNLFNWFSARNTRKANEFEAEAAKHSVDNVRNDIALNVAAGYLQLLLSIEQQKATEVQINQTREQLSLTTKQVEAGSLPPLSALELEAQLARDSAAYVAAGAVVQQNILQLKAIMNLDPATPFEPEAPPVEEIPVESLDDLQPEIVYKIALSNQPLQKVNQLRISASEKSELAAKAAMYPSISLGTGISTQYFSLYRDLNNSGQMVKVPYWTQLGENTAENISINLSVPIFNSGSAKINYQRAKLNTRNLQLQQDNDDFNLKQKIYSAYNDATAALKQFYAAKKTVEISQKTNDFSKRRYELGMLNTIDLITSQNNLLAAQIELLRTQFDYVFKMKVLEFYKGMGLKLQ